MDDKTVIAVTFYLKNVSTEEARDWAEATLELSSSTNEHLLPCVDVGMPH